MLSTIGRRSMMINPKSRARRRKLALVLSILAAASLTGGAVAGMAAANESPTLGDYGLKVLSGQPADSDVPAEMTEADTSLQVDSLRLLTKHEGTRYWVGLDDANNICLAAYFGSADWVSGQACTTPEVFAKQGAGLRLYGPEGLIEAYLVPDSATVAGLADKVTTNLYVVDPYTPTSVRAANNKLAADDRSSGFRLAYFEEPFTLEDPK
ncbi:hypothetical protein L2X99_12780 [Microbacterium sp. KUDC0406]|uniref:hypothetical protein n=1 Tax=Microbacterium sp. KUDC0406 TaxID=2909588 RepID=UPI001F46F4D2|nr:hypothetical protein [Microbacterium sp. KUDC0406]UJP09303.1 hypothetical protein L2X99_12780 [Microbacterium sp. KUDC0406]